MIHDLNDLPDGHVLETDICIIGAGAAGISIANEFKDSRINICLLESGDLALDMETQKLYDVENVGVPLAESITSRLRFFGGTTNHWDGRCAPLNDIDFRKRDWVPHSGWPLQLKDLQPYYKRACVNCDLGHFDTTEDVFSNYRIPASKLDPEQLESQIWKFSLPTRFGPKYRQMLDQAENIDLLLNANVTHIQAAANGSTISHVNVTSLDKRHAQVKARKFILCCGGIENARILLLSHDIHSNGLGNKHDLVGRYFMEHLRSKGTVVHFDDPYEMKRTFNTYRRGKDHYIIGMRTSEKVQQDNKLLNAGALTYFEGNPHSATHAVADIKRNISKGKPLNDLDKNMIDVLRDMDELIINTRRRFIRPESNALIKNITVLSMDTEQAPNPDSRITLGEEIDQLGLRRSKVDWRLNDLDKETTIESQKIIAAELARNYRSRFRMKDWMTYTRADWAHNFRDVAHHMGTTRMSLDPREGVVDQDCRVHGIGNLYVAGSSVFPTSGFVNPTLTIVALAMKLADHLKEQMTG